MQGIPRYMTAIPDTRAVLASLSSWDVCGDDAAHAQVTTSSWYRSLFDRSRSKVMANTMKMRAPSPTRFVPAQAGWRLAFAAQAEALLPDAADFDAAISEMNAAIASLVQGRRFSEVAIEMASGLQQRFAHDPELVDALLAHAFQSLGAIATEDVAGRQTFEKELERLAYYDILTGLPNRTYFRERLDAAIAALDSCDSPIAVVFIDLDRFKMINDRFGHDAGDSALLAVGQRILATMQDGESVARLGGDEFALLIEQATAERALATARRVLQALTQPFPEHQRFFSIDASAGVAVSSCDLASPPDLLRAADIALYHSKRIGGGVATLFESSMSDAAYQRAELERNLQQALDRHEMEPWFQPEYDLATGELRSFEVLMRWRTSTDDMSVPDDFMEVAIEMGIIIPLGLHVLREACEHVVRWNADNPQHAPVSLSFNVSHRELHQPDYPQKVAGILRETGLEPGLLGVEVDDSVFREHTAELDRFVEAIRRIGVQLVLDGFSGGHASLPEIQRVRPNRIKIARRAIGESGSDQIDVAILNVVTTIARALDVPVTAVGLADGKLIERARDAGCHRAQCNLLHPPIPAEKVTAILGIRSPVQTAVNGETPSG